MPATVDLLTGLDDEQREAVLAARGPVCVLAGAGTGKTRTITHRIAHLVANGHVAAGQVLAVTFTSRAAGEMRARLRAMDAGAQVGSVQALTFHAAARRQLHYFWPRVVGDTGWQLLDTKFAVVAQAANRARLQVSTDDVRDLAGEIEWAKASLISPEGYGAAVAEVGRDIPLDAEKVAAVYAGYEKLKANRDGIALLDFDDLLLHTAAAIENDPAVAEEFRDRYRCFVVDEYQDVTPLQQRVLERLARRPRRPHRRRRRQPDHLLVHRRLAALPARLLPPLPRRDRGAPGARLPLHPAGGVAGQPGDRRGARPDGRQQAASGRPASPRPGADVPRTPRRGRRGRRGGPLHQEAHRIRHARSRSRGALPHQRAVRGLRGGAHRGRHPVPGARRGGVLQPPGDPAVAGGVAARPAGARGSGPHPGECCPRWCGRCWNRWV